MQLRVRSGGHDFEGLSYTSQNPFVIVDMRNFRSISIDTEGKTAWVQVGATLGQLYYTLARKSRTLAFTAGMCPTVGVGGHFSGGGYGMMSRKHAIASDNIIDAKLIDANGRILDRESMGDDLFWAIRGGGGTSFGIILAFKVDLVTVPETVTVFNVTRTLEQNATQLVNRWQYIADKVDENLVIRLTLRSVRSPTSGGNRTIVAYFTALYLGRANDLLPLMQREFPELGVVARDCIEMSWIESTLFFAGLHNQSLDVLLSREPQSSFVVSYSKGKSDYVTQPIPINGFRGIWRFLHEEDEDSAELQFSPYGGAMSKLSESETPFPHRAGTTFMIYYGVHWERQGDAELQRHVDWIRRLYSYMAPYVTQSPRAAYFNYRDLDIGMNNIQGNTSYRQASVWGRKYFKNNFDRLVRVKTQFDPSNFFRNEQSIPPMSRPR
ncbi:cannabidiolic acid synthase [Phtheirospermum japonicum]|uniref:Cannabidiolic acid synthase n=1 Tax=Phtheirospermum japonicum TaxID=374723 RepID=A0A830CJH5_9LAMI|nr:cannabidiolic acid synthase [Phtheirospermum japonicum]